MSYDNLMVCLKENLTPELCEDVNRLIGKLEKANKDYREALATKQDELVLKDYQVQNQKNALDAAKTTLENMTKENKALKDLVKLWA